MYLVLCTCPAGAKKEIVSALVERRLASCATTLGDVEHWRLVNGEVVKEDATLLAVVSVRERFRELAEAIEELGSGQPVPIVALAVVAGNRPFVHWTELNLGVES